MNQRYWKEEAEKRKGACCCVRGASGDAWALGSREQGRAAPRSAGGRRRATRAINQVETDGWIGRPTEPSSKQQLNLGMRMGMDGAGRRGRRRWLVAEETKPRHQNEVGAGGRDASATKPI